MREFLRETNKTFYPTKYLIGSMFGTKILLITPLLRWYIEHGLLVTKIYQFIEFCPKRAFSPFEESVTNDRRAGDGDPAYKAIADTSKLIGNSFYGYTIMNKGKHLSVEFCRHEKASKLINGIETSLNLTNGTNAKCLPETAQNKGKQGGLFRLVSASSTFQFN